MQLKDKCASYSFTTKNLTYSVCQVSLVVKYIFLRFCLCISESDTVKSDCPIQIFRKMIKYLKI